MNKSGSEGDWIFYLKQLPRKLHPGKMFFELYIDLWCRFLPYWQVGTTCLLSTDCQKTFTSSENRHLKIRAFYIKRHRETWNFVCDLKIKSFQINKQLSLKILAAFKVFTLIQKSNKKISVFSWGDTISEIIESILYNINIFITRIITRIIKLSFLFG